MMAYALLDLDSLLLPLSKPALGDLFPSQANGDLFPSQANRDGRHSTDVRQLME